MNWLDKANANEARYDWNTADKTTISLIEESRATMSALEHKAFWWADHVYNITVDGETVMVQAYRADNLLKDAVLLERSQGDKENGVERIA